MKVMREAYMEGEKQKKNIEWERSLQQKYITYIYGNIINLFLQFLKTINFHGISLLQGKVS